MRRPPNHIVQVLYEYLDDAQTTARIYLQATEEWKAPAKHNTHKTAPVPTSPPVLLLHCESVPSPWGDRMWRGEWSWSRGRHDTQPIPDERRGHRYWSNPGLVGVDHINYTMTPRALRALGFASEVDIVNVRQWSGDEAQA